MYHPSYLKPETREQLIQAQEPAPNVETIELTARCMAYRSADLEAARLSLAGNTEAARIAVAVRDRFYTSLKPLLAQLVQ